MKAPGEHRQPFTRAIWDRWLKKLNEEPHPELAAGILEMRELLQCRCLGEAHEAMDSLEDYRNFVAKTFGTAK